MERYLLFDAGCAVCHQIAHAIEEAAAGKLKAVSIRSSQAREWLEQAYPAGWELQPYFVTVDGDRVRAYAGTAMALRLGWLLGPRQGWRVWNLGRRYGVSWPAGEEFSTERRGFLKRAALFVGSLFFFPRLGSAGGQGQSQGRPRHPLETIRIKDSRELDGAEKNRAVQQAVDSLDVQNVQGETAVGLDAGKAVAFRHDLTDGNTLWAVALAAPDDDVVLYHMLEHPVDWFKSQALYYAIESETAHLIAASVNARLINEQSTNVQSSEGTTGDCNCSVCTGPLPDVYCESCVAWNPTCLAVMCPVCWALCGGNIFCVIACCAAGFYACCTQYDCACCQCYTP